MELDDLKQVWQQQTPENIDVRNDKKIIDMIQNKNYGPLSILKSRFSRHLMIFPLGVFAFVYAFIEKPQLLQNPLMWFFLGFVLYVAGFMYFFYRTTNRLLTFQYSLKQDMEKDVKALDTRYRRMSYSNGIALIALFVFSEILMYYHQEPDYEGWYKVALYWRILAYIGAIALNYLSYRKLGWYKQVGRHIDYLKNMLREME
jgi:hypothetical protein